MARRVRVQWDEIAVNAMNAKSHCRRNYVRHPIYTGLLLAYLSTAIVHGELRGFVGFCLLLLGFGLKLRMEETFMIQQFGNAYLDYKRRVKALVPFVV